MLVSYILVNYGGYVDFFYEKFTTPKATSMIIGDSRSLQGIQPSMIKKYFKHDANKASILNYSFTGAQAISGPLYMKSILRKLDSTNRDGLFIISVNPDFLTSHVDYNNVEGKFRELKQPPHNMLLVDMNPNYEYLFRNYNFFHFKGVFRQSSKMHKDGWLEESNLPNDTAVLDEWKQHQMNLFLKDIESYYISDIRIASLDQLIKKLQQYGEVFLVRMPISSDFLALENDNFPTFDSIVNQLAFANKVKYFDFNLNIKLHFNTYDGHHINKYDGKIFTKVLCDSINKYALNKTGVPTY